MFQLKSYEPVYKQSVEYARGHNEFALWRNSNKINQACADNINSVIRACTSPNDIKKAVVEVVNAFGFERTHWIMANIIHDRKNDKHFSLSNKSWAMDFNIPQETHSGISNDTHSNWLDRFLVVLREGYTYVMTQTVGQYEQKHRMAERNWLTWFNSDLDRFSPNPGLPEKNLEQRYNEILEKQQNRQASRDAKRENKGSKAKPSVLNQIKTSQSEPSSDPASAEPKNKAQGPEL